MAVRPNLFIQTAFLGDLCLSVATLKRLKVLSPETPLWLVARKGFGKLFQELGVVDRVFEVEKKNPESYRVALTELKKNSYRWIISPHESFTSARMVFALIAERKIGYKKNWNFPFFTDRVNKTSDWPEAFRQMALLSPIDPETKRRLETILPRDWTSNFAKLRSPPSWAQNQLESIGTMIPVGLEQGKTLIAVFPGSAWATKKWTTDGFISLCEKLSDAGFQVVLLGSAEEATVCGQIQAKCPSILNLAGQYSLMQTLELLKSSRLVISNDSGGSHLASLTNTPALTLFGPTVIEQGFRPWVDRGAAVFIENLQCRPCGKHGHQKCPLGTHECMKALAAQVVFETALGLLQS
jgi:heptosyltransferase-2